MKFAKLTSSLVKFFIGLHNYAMVADCRRTERASARAFDDAKYQLARVNAAKRKLDKLQEKAVESQGAAHKSWAVAGAHVLAAGAMRAALSK